MVSSSQDIVPTTFKTAEILTGDWGQLAPGTWSIRQRPPGGWLGGGCCSTHLDAIRHTGAVHATGHVHCVAPDVVLRLSSPNHPSHHRANIEPCRGQKSAMSSGLRPVLTLTLIPFLTLCSFFPTQPEDSHGLPGLRPCFTLQLPQNACQLNHRGLFPQHCFCVLAPQSVLSSCKSITRTTLFKDQVTCHSIQLPVLNHCFQ